MSEEREADWREEMDPARLESSRRARARLREEAKRQAAQWRELRAGSASTVHAVKQVEEAPSLAPQEAPTPLTLNDFEICHTTIVLRRKSKGPYPQPHRVAIQIGCGTHLGDIRLDYFPVATKAAKDLPERARVFCTDVARVVAMELNLREVQR